MPDLLRPQLSSFIMIFLLVLAVWSFLSAVNLQIDITAIYREEKTVIEAQAKVNSTQVLSPGSPQSFDRILQAPLFSDTRKMPQKQQGEAELILARDPPDEMSAGLESTQTAPKPEVKLPEPEVFNWGLVGVVLQGNKEAVLLQNEGEEKWLSKGKKLKGWRLLSATSTSCKLEKAGKTIDLQMYEPDLSSLPSPRNSTALGKE